LQIILLGVVWAAIFATQGTFFSELFPANVRYTGLSFGYQIAAAIVGFGPMLWTSLATEYGASPYLFGGLMMAGLLLSLLLAVFSPDTRMITQYEETDEKVQENKRMSDAQVEVAMTTTSK